MSNAILNINSFNLDHIDRKIKSKDRKIKLTSTKCKGKFIEILGLLSSPASSYEIHIATGMNRSHITSIARALKAEGLVKFSYRQSSRGWRENVFSLA